MVRRCEGWDENMLEDLNDPSFTGELLVAAVDNGLPLRVALADIVRGMGVKEFAEKVGMSAPNVVRALDPAGNPTQKTLERMLEPFELRLGLSYVGRRKRQRQKPPRR